MQIAGELITVGDMRPDNVQSTIGVPSVQVQTADGRIVTISGLTREEARSAAECFGKQVAVTLSAASG